MTRSTHLVATTSFYTGDGQTVTEGEILEADHPVVKGHEVFFRPWVARQAPPEAKAENVKAARAAKAENVKAEKEPEPLTGEALDQKAAELEIEGRSSMTADEKRAAIEEASE